MELQDLSCTASDAAAPAVGQALAKQSEGGGGDAPLSCTAWFTALGGVITFDSHGVEPTPLHKELSADHLFLSLIEHHFIRDMVLSYVAATTTIHAALRLGVPVCGHPRLVHGGLTSAVFDETYGALLYNMRRQGQAAFHRVYTARLEVDYMQPLPAESAILCTASVESFEGRKLWLTAQVTEAPPPARGDAVANGDGGGRRGPVVYAKSRALFVIPRDDPGLAAAAGASGPGGGGGGGDAKA